MKDRRGQCPCCRRFRHLSFHHLIPRKVHRRTHFRKHYDRTQLAQGIWICWPCHHGIHRTYDEMTLAREFNTIDALCADRTLRRHFDWVSRQRKGTVSIDDAD